MPDFVMKANDTLPVIEAVLAYSDNTTPDLSGATVSFILRGTTATSVKVNGAATIVNTTEPRVRYSWLSTDTNLPGDYYGEWEVVFASGKKQTFPGTAYHTISIVADLDEDV